MAQAYKLLRDRIHDKGYTLALLSEKLGKDNNHYISQCMRGVTAWKLDEIYQIMRLLDIPAHEMYLYFTEDGKPVAQQAPRKVSANDLMGILADAINAAIG